MIHMFWALLCAHALCDFPLQGDTMAKLKSRHTPIDPTRVPVGAKPSATWFYWLSAHALIHGGAVSLLTGNVALGITAAVAHWVIDFAKCENWTNLHQDQAMHVACTALWAGLA